MRNLKQLAILTTVVAFATVEAFGQATDAVCGTVGQLPCATSAAAPTSAFANALMTAAIPVVLAVGAMAVQALRKLTTKWGFDASAQNTANMESDVAIALKAGITQVLPTIEQHGWNSPQARDAILGAATDYMRQRFPGRTAEIKAAAVSIPATAGKDAPATGDAAVIQTLAARLPEVAKTASESPATPDAPKTPAA